PWGARADAPVRRLGGGAVVPELAVVGVEAVQRRLHAGRRGLDEDPPERPHARRRVRQLRRRLGGHVCAPEEASPVDAVVAAHVVAIDVHHLDRAELHTYALDDEALHRHVVEVELLHRRALSPRGAPRPRGLRRSSTSTRTRTSACSNAASKMTPTLPSAISWPVRT